MIILTVFLLHIECDGQTHRIATSISQHVVYINEYKRTIKMATVVL